ncbi:MAG: hypothetical protein P8Y53_07575 [Pseudolabrys sp.]|jgi:hypothetical protein
MSADALHNLFSLVFGFAVAGLCCSGFRLFTSRLPSFSLLATGPSVGAFAAVPLLMLAAPFLIMRNTLLAPAEEGHRFEFVFLATMIAGFWSLMSGLVLVMVLNACGLLGA